MDRGAQPFCAIEDNEERAIERQAACTQVAEELRAHRLVLGGRLHYAEEPFLPRGRDAQGQDQRILGERLPVEHERDPVVVRERALLELGELARARPREAARDTPPPPPP